jgi:DNA-binding response OmpR family regulator
MRILIVDDNLEITEMISKYIKLKNNQCDVSNDGKTAISLIQENSYDGIILDLAMPEISGFDVLNELEKSDKVKENNIIVLTAVPITENDETLLKRYGVKEILRKPTVMNDLITALEKHTQKQ